MPDMTTPSPNMWRMVWDILTPRERKTFPMMALVAVLGAIAQIVMIASIFPVLKILSDPTLITSNPILARIYSLGGFETERSFLYMLGFASAATILLANAFLLYRGYIGARFSSMRAHSIATRLTQAYLARDHEFFSDKAPSDLSKRIIHDAEEVAQGFIQSVVVMVSATVSAIAIFALLLYVNPYITVIGTLSLLLFFSVSSLSLNKMLQRLGQARSQANGQKLASVADLFNGLKQIRTAGLETHFVARFSASSLKAARTEIHARTVSDMPRAFIQAFFFAGVIIACVFAIPVENTEASAENLASLIPTLGLFAFAGQRLIPDLNAIYNSFSHLRFSTPALMHVHEHLHSAPPDPTGQSLRPFRHAAVLQAVAYTHPGQQDPTLRGIDLTIRHGHSLGIAGGTGAGKTTLVDLFIGLLSPQRGYVEVDGEPLDTPEKRAAWTRRIAYVPQESFTIEGSFADNIALGIADDVRQDHYIQQAAYMACLDEVVAALPEGINSSVGERGNRLSGGQRQRLGLARAFYRILTHDADVLILDEATSALDNTTEANVMARLHQAASGTSVVMIAHRLSTLQRCDKIAVLEKGHIVEQGTWTDLIHQKEGRLRSFLDAGQSPSIHNLTQHEENQCVSDHHDG